MRRSRASFWYIYCIGQLEVFMIKQAPENALSTSQKFLFSRRSTLNPIITIFIVESCKIKHRGINGHANLFTLVSGNNGQGPSSARNALALWNEFCRSGLQNFVEEFEAANWSLVECMAHWIGLSITITFPPKVTNHFFHCPSSTERWKIAWKSWAKLLQSLWFRATIFVWSFSSHFINSEKSLCSNVFSFHLSRCESIPSIVWIWFCECRRLLLVVGMMGCARTKCARVEGGYLNYNYID